MSATDTAANNPQLPPPGDAPKPTPKRKTAAEVKAEIAAQAKAEAEAAAEQKVKHANEQAAKATALANRLVEDQKASKRRMILTALLIAGLTAAAAFAYVHYFVGKATAVTQNGGGATSSTTVNVPPVTPPAATPPTAQPLVSVPPVAPSQEPPAVPPKDAAPATPKADNAQGEAKVAIPASGVNQTVTITIGGGCGGNVCTTATAAPAVKVLNAPNARREAAVQPQKAASPASIPEGGCRLWSDGKALLKGQSVPEPAGKLLAQATNKELLASTDSSIVELRKKYPHFMYLQLKDGQENAENRNFCNAWSELTSKQIQEQAGVKIRPGKPE